jgi:hypothetical protein
MTIYCSVCLVSAGGLVEAITIAHGHAACVRHLAATVVNPITSEHELIRHFEEVARSETRLDPCGDPITT